MMGKHTWENFWCWRVIGLCVGDLFKCQVLSWRNMLSLGGQRLRMLSSRCRHISYRESVWSMASTVKTLCQVVSIFIYHQWHSRKHGMVLGSNLNFLLSKMRTKWGGICHMGIFVNKNFSQWKILLRANKMKYNLSHKIFVQSTNYSETLPLLSTRTSLSDLLIFIACRLVLWLSLR